MFIGNTKTSDMFFSVVVSSRVHRRGYKHIFRHWCCVCLFRFAISRNTYTFPCLGDFASAELALDRALALNERIHGPEHLNTMYSVSILGDLYSKRGMKDKAAENYRRVLRACEKTVEANHPLLRATRHDLAMLGLA